MQKSIKALVEKLQEKQEGFLTGGFGAIKGGMVSLRVATNSGGTCTNGGTCTSTNDGSSCVNSGTCTGTTNTASGNGCSNTGTCFS
jgi:hypothetical protein